MHLVRGVKWPHTIVHCWGIMVVRCERAGIYREAQAERARAREREKIVVGIWKRDGSVQPHPMASLTLVSPRSFPFFFTLPKSVYGRLEPHRPWVFWTVGHRRQRDVVTSSCRRSLKRVAAYKIFRYILFIKSDSLVRPWEKFTVKKKRKN